MSSKENNNCKSKEEGDVSKSSFFTEALTDRASFKNTNDGEDFSIFSGCTRGNQGQETMEMSGNLDEQLQMLAEVISSLELMELKLDAEVDEKDLLHNKGLEEKENLRIKELNKANLREFNNVLNNREVKNEEFQEAPRVNRQLTKILHEDNDYENLSGVLSDTSDEDVIRITNKLREALSYMTKDKRKKQKSTTSDVKSVSVCTYTMEAKYIRSIYFNDNCTSVKKTSRTVYCHFDIQVFHNYTKLAMSALLSTLYSHMFAVFFFICTD